VDEESEARRQEAWERFMEAERRELEIRRNGHLAKLLDGPLPGESPEELEQMAQEDQLLAEQGLVPLRQGDRVWYKHIDELTREDRLARAEAERALTTWLMDRQASRPPPTGGSW
jgi:hypothetical protein